MEMSRGMPSSYAGSRCPWLASRAASRALILTRVPTVLRGFAWRIIRCSTATVGDSPMMLSKEGTLSTINWVPENIR